MNRLKVCHLITDSVVIGGAETFLAELVRHLSSTCDQTVITLTGHGPLLDRFLDLNVPAVSMGMGGILDFAGIRRLASVLRELQPDILHTHLYHASLVGSVLGRILGVPVRISTEHTTGLRGWRTWAARLWTGLSDRSIAVSNAVADVLLNAGVSKDKLVVIPNGLNLEPYDNSRDSNLIRTGLGIPQDAYVIGMVAGFRSMKGHEFLIPAFAQVIQEFPFTYLLLVGDGIRMAEMERLAVTLGVDGRTCFTGFRRDIPAMLSAMDVFVLPSLWEGMPISILEAMAAGLPVVASDVSGVPEVVVPGVTGILVQPGDTDAIRTALQQLILDPDAARRMGESGRRRVVAQFDIRSTAAAYDQLYHTLLGRRAT